MILSGIVDKNRTKEDMISGYLSSSLIVMTNDVIRYSLLTLARIHEFYGVVIPEPEVL